MMDPIAANAILLFPGQGAQSIGMGRALAKEFPKAADLLLKAGACLDLPLADLIQRGPAKDLNRTDNLQPAICCLSAMAFAALEDQPLKTAAVAGHSLGELSACYAAGMFDFETLMRLAAGRGRLMQQAADRAGGGMMALSARGPDMPGAAEQLFDGETVPDACIANINSVRQVVVSGTEEGLGTLFERAVEAGLRATRLPVSGPWHSRAMAPAAEAFAKVLDKTDMNDAAMPVYSSVDSRPYVNAAEVKTKLAEQVSRPVQWLGTMTRLGRDYADMIRVEAAPGKILTGLLLDSDRGARIFRSETPVQLKRLGQALEDRRTKEFQQAKGTP